MLYGTNEYRKKLYKTINEICKHRDIIVLFAGTVGSISRGITSFESDYDVKCLYIPKNRCSVDNKHDEKLIRYRVFLDDEDYNCIAFWEIFSFLNFFAEPYIDSGNKYELIHNSFWLLLSPYAWDPLGLQEKLRFDICKCINYENELLYHFKILEKIFTDNNSMNTQKRVLRLLHATLSIGFIEKYHLVPAINILSLISQFPSANRKLYYRFLTTVNEANKEKRYISQYNDDMIEIERLAERCYRKYCEIGYKKKDYDFSYCTNNSDIVNTMIDTVNYSCVNVPQIESEPFLSYENICRFLM